MRLIYPFLVLLLINGCVERLEVPVIQNAKVLVVDGAVTDQPGPYTVKLFYSSQLNEVIKTPVPVESAHVLITENNTNQYDLIEIKPGVYETNEFTGLTGNTYKVRIETSDGEIFESVPTELKDAGSLNRVFAEFEENVINQNDISLPHDAFYLYIDGTGNESQNLLRWRWKATYQAHTEPEKRMATIDGNYVSDPPPCAGVESGSACTCCDCWVTFYDGSVAISDPALTTGNSFNKVLVGVIPAESKYFYNKLLIRADQLSVSEEVYTFWNLIKSQQEGAVNIFQPEIVKVRGNVFSITNPEEEVFGIFSVSGIAKNELTLTSGNIPKSISDYEVVFDDCRYTGGTNVRPPFY